MFKFMKSVLAFFISAIPQTMILLFAMIFPKFMRNKEHSWEFVYSGDDSLDEGSVAFSGGLIRSSVIVPGKAFNQTIEQGPPNSYLAPDQNARILIEFQTGDLLRRCEVSLGGLIYTKLQGRILFDADSDGVIVSVFKNKWGRSLSYGTGRTYRNSERICQRAYLWRASPGHVKSLFERGLGHADDEFNARFRDAG